MLDANRDGQGDRRGDEGDIGSGIKRCLGQGKSLLPGRAVGQEPDRVEWFLRTACSNSDLAACQRATPRQRVTDVAQNLQGLGHTAAGNQSRGKVSFFRADDDGPPFLQAREVGLSGGMGIHVGIHGGRQEKRTGHCQGCQTEQIVCHAIGKLGQGVGCDGSDDKEVGLPGQTYVQNVCLGTPQVSIGVGRVRGDRLEAQRRYKAGGIFGENGLHDGAGLGQLACQIHGFVCGDATGDAQHDALPVQQRDRHNKSPSLCRSYYSRFIS